MPDLHRQGHNPTYNNYCLSLAYILKVSKFAVYRFQPNFLGSNRKNNICRAQDTTNNKSTTN